MNPNVLIFLFTTNCRDISKNGLLSIKAFLYWTVLGFSHAFIFFFGSYFLVGKDTSLLGNGQVKHVSQMFETVNNVEKNVSLNHFCLAQPPSAPCLR
jgi:hypothetical protein